MKYETKFVAPDEVLRKVGFVAFRNNGKQEYEIVFTRSSVIKDFALRRLHAYVDSRSIDIHFDNPKRKQGNKGKFAGHRANPYHAEVVMVMKKIQAYDLKHAPSWGKIRKLLHL